MKGLSALNSGAFGCQKRAGKAQTTNGPEPAQTKNGPNGPGDVSSWSVKPGVGPQMGPDWPSGGRQKQGRVHR
jgi:hypothetical protein